jgi:hypothetical protein
MRSLGRFAFIALLISVASPLFAQATARSREDLSRDIRANESFDRGGTKVRLEGLEALHKEIVENWKTRDPDIYIPLMLQLVKTLGSVDFGNRRQYYLAQTYAMEALASSETMSVDTECSLLEYVTQNLDDQGHVLKDEEWAKLRKKQAELYLYAMNRISKLIDPNWDPTDVGVLNIVPPPETGLPSGVAPETIKDERLRKEYEQALRANAEKHRRYREQVLARNLLETWTPKAMRYIIWAYSTPPAQLAELQHLLNDNIADAQVRERIIDAVANNKMPDELQKGHVTTAP